MSPISPSAKESVNDLRGRARILAVQVASRVAPRRTARAVAGATRAHLGSGDHLLEGWANLDIGGPEGVVLFDLTRPLPFDTGSLEFVFSEHFIEHVPLERAEAVLAECRRVLRPGGVLRVSTPDLRRLVDEYVAGRSDGWADMGWLPDSPCDLLNEGMRLWGHLYLFDEDKLTSTLRSIGFQTVLRVDRHLSEHPELRGLESRPDHGDLILEARR